MASTGIQEHGTGNSGILNTLVGIRPLPINSGSHLPIHELRKLDGSWCVCSTKQNNAVVTTTSPLLIGEASTKSSRDSILSKIRQNLCITAVTRKLSTSGSSTTGYKSPHNGWEHFTLCRVSSINSLVCHLEWVQTTPDPPD